MQQKLKMIGRYAKNAFSMATNLDQFIRNRKHTFSCHVPKFKLPTFIFNTLLLRFACNSRFQTITEFPVWENTMIGEYNNVIKSTCKIKIQNTTCAMRYRNTNQTQTQI